MNCPKCGGTMTSVTVDQASVERCENCGGLWFDLLEHEHIKKARVAGQLDTGDPAVGQSHDSQSRIACPRCSAQMIRMVFPDKPHIHYEACTVCYGLYLDAGEFKDFAHPSFAERIRDAFGHLLHRPRA
jgi:uncharacterized protein